MPGIEIRTSKRGRLWPTEYWKTLIDALCDNGAKHDPRLKNPDLLLQLDAMVEMRGARYCAKGGTVLATHDDTALRLILVHRAPPGGERITLGHATMPATEGWVPISFPFFGTIGNAKYEAQSKLNRDAIAAHFQPELRETARTHTLCLCFRLSDRRRDRDLDNLADALMPVFNRHCAGLDHICLAKDVAGNEEVETLRIGRGPGAITGAGVLAL